MGDRYVKYYDNEEALMDEYLTSTEKEFYKSLKRMAYYKTTSDDHKRGTLYFSVRDFIKVFNVTKYYAVTILKKYEEIGLIKIDKYKKISVRKVSERCPKTTEFDSVRHLSNAKKTNVRHFCKKQKSLITFLFYDSYKQELINNDGQVSDDAQVSDAKKTENFGHLHNIYINNKYNLDRKDYLKLVFFSNKKNTPKVESFCEGGKKRDEILDLKNGKKMERIQDADISKFIDFSKSEIENSKTLNEKLNLELENLKREILDLKNENFDLKTEISKIKNFLNENLKLKNNNLNTEENLKERKSCGKKKKLAVLSDENSKEDKLSHPECKNATEGLKMANTGKSYKFIKPTLQEVTEYCEERRNGIDAEAFIDFYESKGWMVGKNKMKDWKAAVRTWERSHNYSKENADKKNRNDWHGDDELRFKENLRIVTNTPQWREFSNQAYVEFNRDEKLNYYSEFIIKYSTDTKYTETFLDEDMQKKIKEHFINFLNTKLSKKQETEERRKNNPKKDTRSIYERTYEKLKKEGVDFSHLIGR